MMPALWSLGEKWELGMDGWGTSHQDKVLEGDEARKRVTGFGHNKGQWRGKGSPVNGKSQVGLQLGVERND